VTVEPTVYGFGVPAVYSGDANDDGSTSAALVQVVKVATATSLNSYRLGSILQRRHAARLGKPD